MQVPSRANGTPVLPPFTRLVREEKVGAWCLGDDHTAIRAGTSYAVTHTTSREHAALDVYDVAPPPFGSHVVRLRQWMHALDHLGHSGVIKIHDVGTLADGRPYVVREQVEGKSLGALAAARSLPEAEAVAILRAVCNVLVTAHGAGVVHRSLVLEHVAVLTDGSVKLLDWGIAAELSQHVKPGTNASRHAASAADDVYLFGVLMHRLLKWVPRSLDALWTSTLANDPEARPTMSEIERQLASQGATPPRPTRTASSRHVVTRPGIASPTVDRRPFVIASTPAASASELVDEPASGRMALTTLPALRAVATGDAADTNLPDAGDPAPAAPASAVTGENFDTPTVVAVKRNAAPPSRTKSRLRRQALSFAVACVVPAVVAALTWTAGNHARHVAQAAGSITYQPRFAVAVPVHAAPPSAAAAPRAPAPATVVTTVAGAGEATRPGAESPADAAAPRVAARASASPKRPKPAGAAKSSPDAQEREALVVKYRRVGQDLQVVTRQLGPQAVAAATKRFGWIKLDAALSTKTSRQLTAKTLQELDTQIRAARAAH